MASFISAISLERAIRRLTDSKVRQGSLLDYLVVKRTFEIAGTQGVAITESEPSFMQALNEVSGLGEFEGEPVRPGKAYFNPFMANDSSSGYRIARYASNGTNTTIGGQTWKTVIELSEDKPKRKASLRADYKDHLRKVFFVAANRPLPRLSDVALWYFRGSDIEPIVGGESDPASVLKVLSDEAAQRLGLDAEEQQLLFDMAPAAEPEDCVLQDTLPNPRDYLPGFEDDSVVHAAIDGGPNISRHLVTALAAKNFAILTGPSGTGKSRAALILADALRRHFSGQFQGKPYELVPVGPDWTSPKRLLGFRSPFGRERQLTDSSTTNDTYEITDTLRLILRAHHPSADGIPHFLVFDEMNLSHVERYFAPFLSLMEATGILGEGAGLALIDDDSLHILHDILQEQDAASLEAEAAAGLLAEDRPFTLPPNLFFIGTVNVDETTYMFSPKVLDRAHVLEQEAVRPDQYLSGVPSSAEAAMPTAAAINVLQTSIHQRSVFANAGGGPAAILDKALDLGFGVDEIAAWKAFAGGALAGAFDLLKPVGFAFGYRVVSEVMTYLYWWLATEKAAGSTLDEARQSLPSALDRAIFQKVLPKLHGNRRVLGDSLRALEAFFAGHHSASDPPASYSLGPGMQIAIGEANALRLAGSAVALPLSCGKLREMNARLHATGYVSFVS